MTDKEIIKALECCAKSIHKGCRNCPLVNVNGCVNTKSKNALDLIKRQQEEIEHFADIGKMYSEIRAEARAEAIKEFAEKLKTSFVLYANTKNGIGYMNISTEDIDDLVKEMVGD